MIGTVRTMAADAPLFITPVMDDPPNPADPWESRRWEFTRRSRRMLYGMWGRDASQRLRQAMGVTRTDVIGAPDLSANLLASTSKARAALYKLEPRTSHPDDAAALAIIDDLVRAGGLWPQMQRTQRDCIGLREMLVRVDVYGDSLDNLKAVYLPVYPDLVVAEALPSDPSRPVLIHHAMKRKKPDGQGGWRGTWWTWDVWDIRDETNPIHQVLSTEAHKRGTDISSLYKLPEGGRRGLEGPDRYKMIRNGRPVLPYVIYHAARCGQLWDTWQNLEIPEATLNTGVMWSFFGHCIRNASWPQRYTINASPAGSGVEGTGDAMRTSVVADPAAVLPLVGDEDAEGAPSAGQWAASTDPLHLAEAIGVYERRAAAFADMNPADVARVSGDPRSGYALAISRSEQREAQREYRPLFQPVDEELLGLTAALANVALNQQLLPESGYGVKYQELPPSPAEQREMRDHVLTLRREGLITAAEARSMLGLEPPAEGEQQEPPPERRIGEMTTALMVAQAAAAGSIPPESAQAQLELMLGLSPDDARKILAGAGVRFMTTT